MRIAVVGAGISGLTCAWRAAKEGHDVTVLEAGASVGGRMATVDAGGFRVDTGANLLLANYDRLRGLLDELGMEEDFVALHAAPGGILHGRELASFAPSTTRDVLDFRGLTVPARLRLVAYLAGAFGRRRGLDFYDLCAGDDPREERDAWTGTEELMGREVADRVVDPFVRTFQFHSARRASMKYLDALAALFTTRGGFTTHALKRSMQSLPDALAAHLDVRTRCMVRRIESTGTAVLVESRAGRESYDAVVVTAPAPVAAAILRTPTAAQQRFLAEVEYSRTLSVAFTAPADVAGDFEGIWVPFSESTLVAGCANEACKGQRTDDTAVVVFALHEEGAGPLMERSDDEVYAAVSDEWTRLFPEWRGQLTGLHVARWRHAMPVCSPAMIEAARRFWSDGQGDRRVFLCGDHLGHPWLEGAVRCGERVARLVCG